MKLRVLSAAILVLTVAGVCISALQTTRSVRDGVFTEDQRKRGAELVAQRCAACHGADLNGGEEAPALYGANFMANWNGLTVGDLAERIRISMPPTDPDINNAQQRADMISVILSVNGYPSGTKDLESRTELLKQIKIEPRQ